MVHFMNVPISWLLFAHQIFQLMVDRTLAVSCDWIGSGSEDEQSVRAVRLNCQEGHLLWKYPSGALIARILSPSIVGRNQSWIFCIRPIQYQSSKILMFHKDNGTLSKLTAAKEHCYVSSSRLSIFFQTDKGREVIEKHPRAGFYYSVTPLEKKEQKRSKIKHQTSSDNDKNDSNNNDCEPCAEDQLIGAFCTADFVFKGRLLRQVNTKLEFSVDKILRKPIESDLIFSKFRPKSTLLIAKVALKGCTLNRQSDGERRLSTQHLVIGRTRLGQAELLCAPMFNDFEDIRLRLAGRTPCEL